MRHFLYCNVSCYTTSSSHILSDINSTDFLIILDEDFLFFKTLNIFLKHPVLDLPVAKLYARILFFFSLISNIKQRKLEKNIVSNIKRRKTSEVISYRQEKRA